MRRLKRYVEPLLYRVTDGAAMIGFSRSKTYEMIREGAIPHIVLEGQIRVRRRDVLALVEGRGRRA
jgi:excisionase family DNA binding protein